MHCQLSLRTLQRKVIVNKGECKAATLKSTVKTDNLNLNFDIPILGEVVVFFEGQVSLPDGQGRPLNPEADLDAMVFPGQEAAVTSKDWIMPVKYLLQIAKVTAKLT